MGWVLRHLFVYYFAWSSVACFADPIEWAEEKRLQIRENSVKCQTFLAPAEPTVNDSVGVLLSTSDIHDFEARLDQVLEERGEGAILGGHFYVTGIAAGQEKTALALYEEALKKRGLLRSGTSVTILSIPKEDVKKLAIQTAEAVYHRIRHFFPSIKRHYESPLKGEVVAGLASNAAIELPNVVYLYNTLPAVDANLAVVTHTTILLSYIIYNKFILNWLLDPVTTKVEGFLKNAILSFPFILNYSVFGNFSKIAEFYNNNGWEATMAAFPEQLANFGTTQGLTLFLQVLFYQVVITNGLGRWQNTQTGRANSEKARTITKILQTPILVGDAITLAMAGANANPLMSFGAFDINSGHLALAGMSLVGSILYFKPNVLNPTLRWHDAIVAVWKRMAKMFQPFRVSTKRD